MSRVLGELLCCPPLAMRGFVGKNDTMSIDRENPSNPDSEHEQLVRFIAHRLDIEDTKLYKQLLENPEAVLYADSLIHDVDEFLKTAKDGLTSREERDFLLQKLDTAIAIANEPFARDLRQYLLERYGE